MDPMVPFLLNARALVLACQEAGLTDGEMPYVVRFLSQGGRHKVYCPDRRSAAFLWRLLPARNRLLWGLRGRLAMWN